MKLGFAEEEDDGGGRSGIFWFNGLNCMLFTYNECEAGSEGRKGYYNYCYSLLLYFIILIKYFISEE